MFGWKEISIIAMSLIGAAFAISAVFCFDDKSARNVDMVFMGICLIVWVFLAGELIKDYRERIVLLVTLLNGKYIDITDIKNRGVELERHECPCCKNDFLDVYQQIYFDTTLRYFTRVRGVFYHNVPLFEMCGLYVCGCARCGARTEIYLDKNRAIHDWKYGYLVRNKENNKK